MSRLLRAVDGAASLGSFVIHRPDAPFRPWSADEEPSCDNSLPIDMACQIEEIAYARGLAEGRATVEAEVAAERHALTELVEGLQTLRPEPTLPLAMLLAETVDRLVREVVGEVEIDGLLLLVRCKAAAALVGDAIEPARLRLHPDDAALIADAELEVTLEPDPDLRRGTVLLETADGWIEDGPAVRLERLRAELDKVAAAR